VVGDILIEIKHKQDVVTLREAVGQVSSYAQVWTQGPVLLLLCVVDSTLHLDLARAEMRDLQNAKDGRVLMVLAG
jgi:hypothetical protein